MWARIGRAVPALLAGVAGVGLYYLGDQSLPLAIIAFAVVAGIGLGLYWIGKDNLKEHPVTGVWLMNGWTLGLVAVGAGTAALLVVLGLWVTELLSDADEAEAKEIGDLVTGAVATFAASVFLKELEEGQGDIWPAAVIKGAIQKDFENSFGNTTKAYEAVWEERVQGKDISGWGLIARHKRAKVIAEALAK